jgi:nucleoside-diphosphate-sugar epimerase
VTVAGRRLLVTGATGFVGSVLAARLADEGAHVVGLSREVREPDDRGIEWIAGDLEDPDAMNRATRDMDGVFHVGGMVGHYGNRGKYLRANVLGTRELIRACRRNGVRTLVFTSTPSVIADGTAHFGVDETHPYSHRFQSPYSESKALAEQEVRAANGPELRTVCIRPHMIWGPGRSHWVGGLRKLAATGKLYQVGDGMNRVGMTYMDDCIEAHMLAFRAVEADAAVGGQVFFVHGGEPVLLWRWVSQLAEALGLEPVKGELSKGAVKTAATVCDALVTLSGGRLHFPLSRYLFTELTTDHYSRIDRARSWLGYEPRVSVEDGIERLARISSSSVDSSAMASINRLPISR